MHAARRPARDVMGSAPDASCKGRDSWRWAATESKIDQDVRCITCVGGGQLFLGVGRDATNERMERLGRSERSRKKKQKREKERKKTNQATGSLAWLYKAATPRGHDNGREGKIDRCLRR